MGDMDSYDFIPMRNLCDDCWILRMEFNLGIHDRDDHPCQMCVDKRALAHKRVKDYLWQVLPKSWDHVTPDRIPVRAKKSLRGVSGVLPPILQRTRNWYKPSPVDWERLVAMYGSSSTRKKGEKRKLATIFKDTSSSNVDCDLTKFDLESPTQPTSSQEEELLPKLSPTVARRLAILMDRGDTVLLAKAAGKEPICRPSKKRLKTASDEARCTTSTP